MTRKFAVGLSADLFGSDGSPSFDRAILDAVSGHPGIETSVMEHGKTHIEAEDAERFDAVYLMVEKVEAARIDTPGRRLRLVARHGVGFDSVDVDGMTGLGVLVTNTPAAVRRPVATMAITLLLALSHRLIEKHNLTRAGRWSERVDYMGTGLTGRVLGVLGAGSIGSEILRLAAPFDMVLKACDPHVGEAHIASLGAAKVDAEELFSTSDFVVVATSLDEGSRHFVDAGKLSLMKRGASVVNVARGPIINEPDLVEALRDGRLGGAALDVFEREPVDSDNPLLEMDNVITTPHALCFTDECFDNIARDGLGSILDFVAGNTPAHIVNPEALGA